MSKINFYMLTSVDGKPVDLPVRPEPGTIVRVNHVISVPAFEFHPTILEQRYAGRFTFYLANFGGWTAIDFIPRWISESPGYNVILSGNLNMSVDEAK